MSRAVKIGNTNIGLVGIEGALNQLKKEAADSKINPAQAGARLLEAVKSETTYRLRQKTAILKPLPVCGKWKQAAARMMILTICVSGSWDPGA